MANPTMNKLRKWLDEATKDEIAHLVRLSKRTLGTIRQVAGGYRTDGKARTTPEVALSIEKATISLHRAGLPPVLREDLCPACAKCDYLRLAKQK